MEKNLVSVIIPVYNHERYIKQCLLSVCCQSYFNLEIIVVNDGSTDRSADIIQSIADRDKRVKVVDQTNSGVSKAREKGLSLATGDFLTFIDSDDYLEPTAIEILAQLLVEKEVDVVYGNMCRQFSLFRKKCEIRPGCETFTRIENPHLFQKYYVSFFGKNLLPVNMWGNLYRMSVITSAMQKTSLFSQRVAHMGEDEYFNLKIFPYVNSVWVTDAIVYNYRWGGITSTFNRYMDELFDFGDERILLLDKYHYDYGYKYLFIEYKNVLNSHLLQKVLYKNLSQIELEEYIKEELGSRYLVQRMREYYSDGRPIPPSLQLIMSNDVQAISNMCFADLSASKRKLWVKSCLARIMRVIGVG